MRPLADAQRQVLGTVQPLPTAATLLADCLGLALAEPLSAPEDVPPFDNSAMDGYALAAADADRHGAVLDVAEHVAAGAIATGAVSPGKAIKVMTGAPVPAGTATVVKVEDTEPLDGQVRIVTAPGLGVAVRPAGGDIASGTVVFDVGTTLGPAHLGVLASLGVAAPLVRRRPVAAVLSTGDEVAESETTSLAPGMIRDANRTLLTALLTEAGAEVRDLGIVSDDRDAFEAALTDAVSADVVVTSGGVSMGDHDVVKDVLSSAGTVEFWKVAMQPAKPVGFGTLPRTDGTAVPFFGLPGNPVSVLVAFEQYLRPALLHMMGHHAIFRPRSQGILDDGASADPQKDVFLRVVTRHEHGTWHARSAGGQFSNVLSATAIADAFAVIPVGVADVPPGGTVTIEHFRHPATRTLEEALDG